MCSVKSVQRVRPQLPGNQDPVVHHDDFVDYREPVAILPEGLEGLRQVIPRRRESSLYERLEEVEEVEVEGSVGFMAVVRYINISTSKRPR